MTEDEYKRLKATIDRIAEHQKKLAARARDAEDSFTPVENRLAALLATAKKRIIDQINKQRPSLNE